MRVVASLRRELEQELAAVHRARLDAVFAVLPAVFQASHVGLTALGRALGGTPKHSIKRVDRLLGNRHLQRELDIFYRSAAHFVLRGVSRPVLLVDWTAITPEQYALVAAARVQGRSVPLYAHFHPRGQDGNPAVELEFLEALRGVLPKGCRPIVVTDAGFRMAWMKRIVSYGWDFVGRLRGGLCVKLPGEQWQQAPKLHKRARTQPRRFDQCWVAKSNPTQCSVVLYDGRSAHAKRSQAKLRQGRAEASAQRAREPWVLVTSLRCRAKRLVSMYRHRMQIEEMFRDAKCGRFGLGLRMTLSRDPRRLAVLFLLTSLALIAAMLVGLAAYRQRVNRRFQANTRTQRVLSFVALGVLVIRAAPSSFSRSDVNQLRSFLEQP